MSRTLSIVILAAAVLVATIPAAAPGENSGPALIHATRFSDTLDFCGEPGPVSDPQIRERLEKEMLLTVWDRPQVILWLKRSTRYLPRIRQMLAENGMPSDLQYLSIIESALRPHVGSPKGALGFWQFTAETGRTWGLRIDARIDERRNLTAATAAAIRYLKALFDQFGSWTLAAAAYNMGEAGLAAQIEHQGQSDFYRLYLPIETQRYVLRAVAAKQVVSDPDHFGFHLAPMDYWSPETAASVTVKSDIETPLVALARAAGISFADLKRLNPEIRGFFLPPDRQTIMIPPDAAEGFSNRLTNALANWQRTHPETVYIVRPGDHLTGIAERFDVSLHSLLIWNRLDPSAHIHPGDHLVLYAPSDPEELSESPETPSPN